MKGKVALVTGASRGRGRATAKLLAAEGACCCGELFSERKRGDRCCRGNHESWRQGTRRQGGCS